MLDPDFITGFEEKYGATGKAVSRLIRPALIARPNKTLVWSDWSAIEARVLPWLANSPGAEKVLDVFRANDADPDLPDIYEIEAAGIYDEDAVEIHAARKDGDKAAKDMRQVGKVSCIAAGQLVATDQGYMPIERVPCCARVWDGVEWVEHNGPIYRGYKNVYTYEGLTATADHRVWTDTGRETTLGRCIVNGWRLARGDDADAVRLVEDRKSGHAASERVLESAVPVYRLRHQEMGGRLQPARAADTGVPEVLATACGTEVVGAAHVSRPGPLSQCERPGVGTLRGARHQVRVLVSDAGRGLGYGEPRSGKRQRTGPDRQRRPLRAGQPTMGDTLTAALQSGAFYNGCEDVSCLSARRLALQPQHRAAKAAVGNVPRSNPRRGHRGSAHEAKMLAHYSGKAHVYDLVNAGPRHRFTVSNVLVHNCLALGFGGGVGALEAMATGYGIHMEHEQQKFIVNRWRFNNPWAVSFWSELMEAFTKAQNNPGEVFVAGRVAYIYLPKYLRGTMQCYLPDGRPITYAALKRDKIKYEDEATGEMVTEWKLRYQAGYERRSLWHGILAENITQATAASLLRGCLVRLEHGRRPMRTVGHTHDEIISECDMADEDRSMELLKQEMEVVPDWAGGLPLVAEASSSWYYTKAVD